MYLFRRITYVPQLFRRRSSPQLLASGDATKTNTKSNIGNHKVPSLT